MTATAGTALLSPGRRGLSYQATLGKAVKVQAGLEEFTGEACGLDDDGSLLVRLGSGQVRRCIAGEVTFVG